MFDIPRTENQPPLHPDERPTNQPPEHPDHRPNPDPHQPIEVNISGGSSRPVCVRQQLPWVKDYIVKTGNYISFQSVGENVFLCSYFDFVIPPCLIHHLFIYIVTKIPF